MKKYLSLILFSALFFCTAGTLRVYNGSNGSKLFTATRTGDAPATLALGSANSGMWTTGYNMGTASGANYYRVSDNTFTTYAIPDSPQLHVGDQSMSFFYMGTNECVFFDKTINITNFSPNPRRAVMVINGVRGSGQTIAPGAWFPFTFEDMGVCTNGNFDSFSVQWLDTLPQVDIADGNLSFTLTNRGTTIFTNGGLTALYTNTEGYGDGSPITGRNPVPWQNQTNSVINFSGTSTTAAKDDTLKAGFNGLMSKLDALGDKIDLNTGATLQGSGGTNEDGVASAINRFHTDNTNLLGQINGILGRGTNYTGAGSGTNGTDAMSQAMGIMGTVDGTAQGVLDDLGEAPSILSGGSSAGLTFTFAGQEMNLDPEVRFPGAATFFKSGIMLLVTLWLGRYLVDLYLRTAQVYASSQTGGVPAVGPWGSVGLGISLLVAIAVVTLWAVVFTGLFTYGLNHLSTVSDTVAGFTTSNATALYLINLFFPISFLLTAAWTRLVAPFAVTKIIILTASAQRFLLGK